MTAQTKHDISDLNIKEIRVENIDKAYNVYKTIISNKTLCQNNQAILSILAFQIDAFSLAAILNFFNKHTDLSKENWQSNLLIIRMFAIFVTEIMSFLSANNYFDATLFDEPNSIENVKLLRNKIHQFRYNDFKKKIQYIDYVMGRSRDKFAPHIDVCLQYTKDKLLMGTNIYCFNFPEAKEQITVNFMQQIVRCVEKTSNYPKVDFVINRNDNRVIYNYVPYCYVDIVKNCKLGNKELIDRLLLAFDDMCSIHDFFVYVVDVSDYLRQAPYIIFYFVKMLAIMLDETFDNLDNILKYNKNDDDAKMIETVLNVCPLDIRKLCKCIRNNIHYERQDYVLFDDELALFEEMMVISGKLLENIRDILNINPSKARLRYYKFLKWIQE